MQFNDQNNECRFCCYSQLLGLVIVAGISRIVSMLKSNKWCYYFLISFFAIVIIFLTGGYFALVEFSLRVSGL